LSAALLLSSAAQVQAAPPRVAVASNFTDTLTEIAAQFRAQTGVPVRLSFGSSGNFAHQIMQGAPYDIFLSADDDYIEKLGTRVSARTPIREFAEGTLCVFVPAGSQLADVADADGLFHELTYGHYRRISIANPEYAPYGVAARQAMQSGGLWVLERDRVLIGESVAQAAQFALSGGVDAGFVPCSFSVLDTFRRAGKFITLPDSLYKPIRQYAVLLRPDNADSRRFFDFLFGDKARAVVVKYGYRIPAAD
jgi:molybdate transport system substrate-binding protein